MTVELYRTHQINAEKGHQYRIEAEGRVVFVWYSMRTGLTTCQDKPLKKWRDLAIIGWGMIGGFVVAEVVKWLA